MIGKLDFFHTDSECGEIEGTFALEADMPKFGFKLWSCHLLDIQSQLSFITCTKRKTYIGHADRSRRIWYANNKLGLSLVAPIYTMQ